MAKATYPNAPGSYELDGVSLIVLPNQIILDTGNRRVDPDRFHRDGEHRRRDRPERKEEAKKEPEKKEDWFNKMLDNAQDVVMGKSPKK